MTAGHPTNPVTPNRPRRRVLLIVLTVVVAAVLLYVLYGWLTTREVQTTRIMVGPVVQAFYATGTVQPEKEFPVRASAAGRLSRVMVDRGDTVLPGQLLAVIDDPVLRFAVDRDRAAVDEKRARADDKTSPVLRELDARITAAGELLKTADRDVERLERLVRTSSASDADRDRAGDIRQSRTADLQALVAQRASMKLSLARELGVAEAALQTSQAEFDQQSLKSPVDGVVLDRPTSAGTRVAVNDTLMRVADIRPENLVMRAAVDEEDVTKCRVGQTVRMSLYAFPGRPISGSVKRVYSEADRDRRTFEIDVAFNSTVDRLAVGMTGELAFVEAERPSARVVPSTAAQQGVVWVVDAGRLVRREVTFGLRSVDRVEVVEGLGDDDRVVITPIGNAKAGDSVRATDVDPGSLIASDQPADTGGGTFKGFN